MKSLTFVFEATLLAPLVEFATSSSGHVEPRQGLALGWLGSVVAGLAVMFGTADRAQADSCYGLSHGSCTWVCNGPACRWDHELNPTGWYKIKWCHDLYDGCQPKDQSCIC